MSELKVDGKDHLTSKVVTKEAYPLQIPFFRPNDIDNMGGFYVTFPVAYTTSLRIILKWRGSENIGDKQLWNKTKACKKNASPCPICVYYAVILNKLTHGAKLKSNFMEYDKENSVTKTAKFLKDITSTVAAMAVTPEKYGAGMKSGCKLICKNVPSGGEVAIYDVKNGAKVIQSILLRLYDVTKQGAVISKNWKRILITMQWDGKEPQVKEVPLAGLFTTGLDYLREVRSLTAGFRETTCNSQGAHASKMKPDDWLAYLFYEMPFWKSAKISVRIPKGYESAVICSKVHAKELNSDDYHPWLTGYFSAQLHQQSFDTSHHKTMLHLEKQWGHVVAINFFLMNKKIASTHELDVIIETDGANSPVFSGTGLEDFFHYVHDFQANRNMTSAFNGAPYYYRKGSFRILRCYRHMILDPILFTTGIRIYLEARFDRARSLINRKFSESSVPFNQRIQPDSLFTVALFYGGKGSGGLTTDKVVYNETSGKHSPHKLEFTPPMVYSFPVHTMFENQPGIAFNRVVVSMKPGQKVTHTFNISRNNIGVILRREYRTVVPNQKAKVEVNSEDVGLWFCPQRALTPLCTLRLSDFLLPARKTSGKHSIEVTLGALTEWETVSIEAISVMLSN